MFGYSEPDFTVEKTFELTVEGSLQKMQIRVEVPDPNADAFLASLPESLRKNTRPRDLNRYIALESYDAQGNMDLDVLLRYSAGDNAKLDADWERLVTDEHVLIKDLTGWEVRIHGHATGYFRGGGVAMY
jgi:hypothetical protein